MSSYRGATPKSTVVFHGLYKPGQYHLYLIICFCVYGPAYCSLIFWPPKTNAYRERKPAHFSIHSLATASQRKFKVCLAVLVWAGFHGSFTVLYVPVGCLLKVLLACFIVEWYAEKKKVWVCPPPLKKKAKAI
jgi:hypothetical protein